MSAAEGSASHIHRAGVPLHPFLFMGCWNEPEVRSSGVLPRDEVAKAIQKNGIANVVLGGDNIYPTKSVNAATGKKVKVHSIEVFKAGVELLSGKQIFSSLGNHNVEEDAMREAQLHYENWVLPSRYYAMIFTDGFALVVLDTNLEGDEFSEMLAWLTATVSKLQHAGLKYYVVQHDPYASYKLKVKKDDSGAVIKTTHDTVFTKASDLLHKFVDYPPVAILCADTHNYQKGLLHVSARISIPQYVVGTGGAQYDRIGETKPIRIADDITMTFEEKMEGYGYLEIRAPTTVAFRKVLDWEAKAGGGRAARSNKKSRRVRAMGPTLRKTRRRRHRQIR
jgi:hypothetical protein